MTALSPLEQSFLDAVRDYEMYQPGDRVIIAVSGGKDSFTLLNLTGRLRAERFPQTQFMVSTIKTDIT